MVSITLESASNGIIKRVVDNNHAGAGGTFSLTKVYEIERDGDIASLQSHQFLADLIRDLALDLGNERNREVLVMNLDWGEKYSPSVKEINEKIAGLKHEIDRLKELKVFVQQTVKK